jgi:hypothetical protein
VSKPFKRPLGDRSIPNWQPGVSGETFGDISYEVAEGLAKSP